MPPRGTTELERAHRRRSVAQLYLDGVSVVEIAQRVGFTTPTIYNDLSVIKEQWQEQANAARRYHLSVTLARLDRIEREAWAAWERSKSPRLTKVGKTRIRGGEEERTRQQKEESRDGDPHFLRIALDVAEQRAKLLGLYQEDRDRDRVITLAEHLQQSQHERLGLGDIIDGDIVEG